ncbi:MAG: M23 family metallopeptidase [Bacteroidales bacterium]|jgi:murein DD-endopeptidase MepM/ murein hydrolase activator NlpD
MGKSKYRFNTESLNYDKVRPSLKKRLLILVSYLSILAVIAILLNIFYASLFDTPREKILKRENSQLNQQFEILNQKIGHLENVLDDIEKRDDNIYRTIFNADPIPHSVRDAGFGGVNRYEYLEGYDNSDKIIETARRLDQLSKAVYVQSKSYDEVIDMAKNRELQLSSLPAIQPISNKDLTRTASGWGYRIHPIYKIRKFHHGMDFTAPTGTEVYATADGTVELVDRSRRGYGNKVVIDHGFGYKTIYAHLEGFNNLRKGQKVKRGDVIAYVGNTGLSTAPHLHYEVHLNAKKINPINYYFEDLTAEEYDRMIILSLRPGQSYD